MWISDPTPVDQQHEADGQLVDLQPEVHLELVDGDPGVHRLMDEAIVRAAAE